MKKYVLSPVLIILFFNVFCASSLVKIGQIRDEPTQYSNRIVSVSGNVEDVFAVPIINVVLVKINDGTGSLWVKPADGDNIPPTGKRMDVKGEIKTGITISGQTLGLLLIERGAGDLL